MSTRTILDKFDERVRAHPDKSALRYRTPEGWADVTWGSYGDEVARVARGLMAYGLEPGDRMSLLASNRPEWFFADLGCLSLGATTAPIYHSNSPEQVAHVIGHSRSKVAVVEDSDQMAKVLAMRAQLPQLERVVVMDGPVDPSHGGFVSSWQDLLGFADRVDPRDLTVLRGKVVPEDVATFVYTSGTTGAPKAVMLTHGNIWWTCESLERHLQMGNMAGGRALSYLPLSHIAERMVSHLLQILFGSQTWFARSFETLPDDLRDCRPTYFFGVPRVWEKFYEVIQIRLAAKPASLKDAVEVKLLRRALDAGMRVTDAEQDAVEAGLETSQARLPMGLQMRHAVLERLVLSKARARAGLDRCTRTFSAAAPLDPSIVRFFHAMGLPVAEGYGQSETTGPTSWNPPHAIGIGTVGIAIPGLQLRIAPDGEILVRGGNVTPGYFEDQPATQELLDPDGWLHSGDIGHIDAHGYLTVTDRKKDLIITSGGKNVAPQELENRLRREDLVSQVVVIGDGRPFLTALVTLDEEKASAWARGYGITEDMGVIARDERTIERIIGCVNALNSSLARAEAIKKFRILERDFVQSADEITPTLKVKRKRITEKLGAIIEDMYERDSPVAASAAMPEPGAPGSR